MFLLSNHDASACLTYRGCFTAVWDFIDLRDAQTQRNFEGEWDTCFDITTYRKLVGTHSPEIQSDLYKIFIRKSTMTKQCPCMKLTHPVFLNSYKFRPQSLLN